jgi:hypothetical protein
VIRFVDSKELLNKYAFVLEPVSKEDKDELMREGYFMSSRYKLEHPDNPDYGKYEQMWIK